MRTVIRGFVISMVMSDVYMRQSVNESSIGSNNSLLPFRRRAIIWPSPDLLSTGTVGTNFSEIFYIEVSLFLFMIIKSKILSWRLKSSAARLLFKQFVEANYKENIKAPHHWPFVIRRFPSQRDRDEESVSMSMCHHTLAMLMYRSLWQCGDVYIITMTS